MFEYAMSRGRCKERTDFLMASTTLKRVTFDLANAVAKTIGSSFIEASLLLSGFRQRQGERCSRPRSSVSA